MSSPPPHLQHQVLDLLRIQLKADLVRHGLGLRVLGPREEDPLVAAAHLEKRKDKKKLSLRCIPRHFKFPTNYRGN